MKDSYEFLHPMSFCFRWMGINLQTTNGGKWCSHTWMTMVKLYLLFAACYSLGTQLYLAGKDGIQTEDTWVLVYNDSITTFVFLWLVTSKRNDLIDFIIQTIELAIQLEVEKKELRKWCRLLLLLSFSPLIFSFVLLIIHQLFLGSIYDNYTKNLFADWEPPSCELLKFVVCFVCEFFPTSVVFAADIYFSLIVLLIFLLGECFKKVNQNFLLQTDLTFRHFSEFQKQHRRLDLVIVKLNSLLSPALLISVAIKVLKLVTATDLQKKSIMVLLNSESGERFQPLFILDNLFCLKDVVKVFITLLMLTKVAHKVHYQSQQRFELVLDSSLDDALFAQNNSKDILKALSVTITYMALVSDFEKESH